MESLLFCIQNQFQAAFAVKKKGEFQMPMKQCHDSYYDNFMSLSTMCDHFDQQHKKSQWKNCAVTSLNIRPLDTASPAYRSEFATVVSNDAIEDTVNNVGLAASLRDPATGLGAYYPVRDTAYKSLLDRAKINGTVLPKLPKPVLADMLNACFAVHNKSNALVLFRDEKISAFHSGDETDYSVLPVNELLGTLLQKLDERFPGHEFKTGYTDHSICAAEFALPGQRDALLADYEKALTTEEQRNLVKKAVPGIFFATSDTGVSSARVSARLTGLDTPIPIGSVLAVDHRNKSKISDFEMNMDQVFAKFTDTIGKLKSLLDVQLQYARNAMVRVCKKLALPKKPALDAIAIFEMAFGDGPASAHDIYYGLQEILFNMKISGYPQSKIFSVEETLTRALSIRWADYDIAGTVSY